MEEKKAIHTFLKAVTNHHKKHGRTLPWRETTDPYHILVSEIMLQQTQVERVIPKYTNFQKQFPNVLSLSTASLGDVLKEWSGLGYNRRAKMLHHCALEVTQKYAGVFPRSYNELVALPGIGPYTAGAVLAFAFNTPHVIIETNIRSVYLHHFFNGKEGVSDKELFPLIEKTLDKKNPRLWYAMLMDYGSWIKKTHGNPNNKSKHYTKQKPFAGSKRQLRGAILVALSQKPHSLKKFKTVIKRDENEIKVTLHTLQKEELVVLKGTTQWQLP